MLPKIKFILDGDKVREITKKDIEILKEMNASLASKALRILAFAYKIIKDKEEENLIFTGLV
jgi:Ca2+-transporting ATPase